MLVRAPYRRLNTLLCLFGLVAFFMFLKVATERYYELRKLYRLQDYSLQLETIRQGMQSLETSASLLRGRVWRLKSGAVKDAPRWRLHNSTDVEIDSPL